MDIEQLIRNLLIEISPLLEKKVIIFLSGGSVNTDILLKMLGDFQHVDFTFVVSENGGKMLNMDAVSQLNGQSIQSLQELEQSLTSAELVLVPVLTRNTLAKVALGIADNLVTTGLARALMMKKEIIAVRDSFSPTNQVNRAHGLTNNLLYNDMLDQYENKLQNFGVKCVDLDEFKPTVQQQLAGSRLLQQQVVQKVKQDNPKQEKQQDNQQQGRKVLDTSIATLTDVKTYEHQGAVILKKGTIITPLAKEYIYQNKIDIQWF